MHGNVANLLISTNKKLTSSRRQAKAKAAPPALGMCAVEVCAPALDLREVPRRRTSLRKLACASSDQILTTTYATGEAISPDAVAALEASSNVDMPLLSASQKHFAPRKETRLNSHIVQDAEMSVGRSLMLRSSMKSKRTKQVVFDEKIVHPERMTVDGNRQRSESTFLQDDHRSVLELQSTKLRY